MRMGLVGTKVGSSRVFDDRGVSTPVTVVLFDANVITQIKTPEKDGYSAIQVATGVSRRLNRPQRGHLKHVDASVGRHLREMRIDPSDVSSYSVNQTLELGQFKDVDHVNVQAYSKGKGFQGCVKRHNFGMQDATHGNSLSHRAPGSIGQCQDPGRVFPGKKMAGRMGHTQCTIRNLKVVSIDSERSLMLIKGAIPGPNGGTVFVHPSDQS